MKTTRIATRHTHGSEMNSWWEEKAKKLSELWDSAKVALIPARASRTIRWVGSSGIAMMFVVLAISPYFICQRPTGIFVDIAKGYLLGFFAGALLHELACVVKREGSELLRYRKFTKGYAHIAAWFLILVCIGSLGLVSWIQATVTMNATTLISAIAASVIASEFSMMYINAVQDVRQQQKSLTSDAK